MSVAILDKQSSKKRAPNAGGAAFDLFVQPIRPIKNQVSFTWGEVLLRSQKGDQRSAPQPVLRRAVEQGLAMELDLLVIAETAENLRCTGIDLLSVNVSGQSISHPDFFQLVSCALDDAQAGFERFCFEITETEPITDIEMARSFCVQARNRGALIALDDFGTGNSNIQLCTPRHVDVLKICQGLVKPLNERPDDLAIVRGLVAMAERIGLVTVAEGVESEQHLAMVKDANVDYIQGYISDGEAIPMIRFALEQEGDPWVLKH